MFLRMSGMSTPWAVKLFSAIEVPMCPGITTWALTCGACRARSTCSASVKPFTANLAAQYDVCGRPGPTVAQNPLMLLVLTIAPASERTSMSMNARAQFSTPFQHTSKVLSQAAR